MQTFPKKVADQVDEELKQLMKSILPPQNSMGQRRFRCAVGLLCLAPFCVTVAFFPWPASALLDKLIWVGFAMVLLLVGTWQIYRSNADLKDADHARQKAASSMHKSRGNVLRLRKRK